MTTFREVAAADLNRAKRTQSQIEARHHDRAHPAPSVSELAEIAERYHDAYSSVGAPGAPPPMPSESRFSYRRRLATGLQRYSPEWSGSDLFRVGVDVMRVAEPAILAATAAAVADRTRGDPRTGGLREVVTLTPGGHRVTEFSGDPRSWLADFMAPARAVRAFRNPVTGAKLQPARRSL